MELKVPNEYEKMRARAVEALIYAGIKVPTDRQIAIYLLTGEVFKEEEL